MLAIILALISSSSFIALLNFLFLASVIMAGALLGSTLRTGKTIQETDNKFLRSNRMIGIGSAFICVPFIASFLHLNYQSLLLPLKVESDSATYIEQLFMLISLAGIASYLGYGLLDNIANKVLQSQVEDLGEEQKETKHSVETLMEENKKIKSNEKNMKLELLYMKAKDAVEAGHRFAHAPQPSAEDRLASKKKYNDALGFLNEGIEEIDENTDYQTYDKFMILKAFILKRLDDIPGALSIVKKLLQKDANNPVLIYNMGCYMLLSNLKDDVDEVKKLIIKALTIGPLDKIHRTRQQKLIERVLARLDDDIKDLFDEAELSRIRELTNQASAE